MNSVRKLIFGMLLQTVFWMSIFSTVHAQEFLADFASFGPPLTSLRFSAVDEPNIEGDRNDSPLNQQKFSITTPVNRVPTDPVYLSWKWSQLNLSTEQSLNTGAKVPHRLYESEFGASYKHVENAQKFWGLSFSYGSASDQLFRSRKTSTFGANFYWSESADPTGRWIWLVNYSNNRTFLNEVPILGVAYLYTPSPDFMGVFGFPFAFVKSKFADTWSASILVGPYIYKLELSKSLAGPLQSYLSLENSNASYHREDRKDEDARLFYSESRALLGIKSPVTRELYADAFAGLAYARSLYEDKDFKPWNNDKVLLENRWLMGANLSARF